MSPLNQLFTTNNVSGRPPVYTGPNMYSLTASAAQNSPLPLDVGVAQNSEIEQVLSINTPIKVSSKAKLHALPIDWFAQKNLLYNTLTMDIKDPESKEVALKAVGVFMDYLTDSVIDLSTTRASATSDGKPGSKEVVDVDGVVNAFNGGIRSINQEQRLNLQWREISLSPDNKKYRDALIKHLTELVMMSFPVQSRRIKINSRTTQPTISKDSKDGIDKFGMMLQLMLNQSTGYNGKLSDVCYTDANDAYAVKECIRYIVDTLIKPFKSRSKVSKNS